MDLQPEVAEWFLMLDDDAQEFFQERAAIMEFDGGLPRIEAEQAAKALTEAFVARSTVFLDRK
jgi:pentose-5-phosphate-3-epimerase